VQHDTVKSLPYKKLSVRRRIMQSRFQFSPGGALRLSSVRWDSQKVSDMPRRLTALWVPSL